MAPARSLKQQRRHRQGLQRRKSELASFTVVKKRGRKRFYMNLKGMAGPIKRPRLKGAARNAHMTKKQGTGAHLRGNKTGLRRKHVTPPSGNTVTPQSQSKNSDSGHPMDRAPPQPTIPQIVLLESPTASSAPVSPQQDPPPFRHQSVSRRAACKEWLSPTVYRTMYPESPVPGSLGNSPPGSSSLSRHSSLESSSLHLPSEAESDASTPRSHPFPSPVGSPVSRLKAGTGGQPSDKNGADAPPPKDQESNVVEVEVREGTETGQPATPPVGTPPKDDGKGEKHKTQEDAAALRQWLYQQGIWESPEDHSSGTAAPRPRGLGKDQEPRCWAPTPTSFPSMDGDIGDATNPGSEDRQQTNTSDDASSVDLDMDFQTAVALQIEEEEAQDEQTESGTETRGRSPDAER